MPEPPCMAGVLALARMPGLVLVPCRVHQAGSSTPNPACCSAAAWLSRNPWASSVFNRYPAGCLRFRLSVMGGHTEPAWARELNRNSAGLKSGWGPLT